MVSYQQVFSILAMGFLAEKCSEFIRQPHNLGKDCWQFIFSRFCRTKSTTILKGSIICLDIVGSMEKCYRNISIDNCKQYISFTTLLQDIYGNNVRQANTQFDLPSVSNNSVKQKALKVVISNITEHEN